MTVTATPRTIQIDTYSTAEGIERELVAVYDYDMWTLFDRVIADSLAEEDLDERWVEDRLTGWDQVAAVAIEYVAQADFHGCPLMEA